MLSNMIMRGIASRSILFRNLYSLEVMVPQMLPNPKYHFRYFPKMLKGVNSFSTRPAVSREYNNSEEEMTLSISSSELVHHLEIDVKQYNKVSFKDLEMLLFVLKKDATPSSCQHDILLLEWCSFCLPDMDPASRISFVHSVWDTLKSNGTSFTVDHYNALLKNYAASRYRVVVKTFLEEMGNTIPNKTTYELLLHCVCVNGDMEEAIAVIQCMKIKEIPVSQAAFNSLILGYARAGDMQSSLTVLETMRAAKLEPSTCTYSVLLQSFGEVGDFKQMKSLYENEVSKQFNLSHSQVMEICSGLAISNHHLFIPKFLKLFPEDYKSLSPTVRNTLSTLIYSRKEEGALTLLMCISLPEMRINKTEHNCTFFVQELCKANAEPSCIIRLCNILEEKEIFPRALYEAADTSMVLGKTDLTSQIFSAMQQSGETLRPHYFWPILKQRALLNGETGVLKTLKEMQNLNVNVDFQTLMDYILPVISSEDCMTTVEKLRKYNIATHDSITPIAACLVNSRKIRSFLNLCKQYPQHIEMEKLLQPLVEFYISKKNVGVIVNVLQPFCKSTENDLAGQFILELLTVKKSRIKTADVFKLLKEFLRSEIYISNFSSEIIIQHWKNGHSNAEIPENYVELLDAITKSDLRISPPELFADHISHPRDMNLEELECHLIELKSKNMNPRGVLRRLLQLHCQRGNTKRVLEIKEELEESGFVLSPGMLSNLFSMYVLGGDSEAARKCLANISNADPNFVVDEFKIIDYATLLISEGQYKAAVSALENRAGIHQISGGKSISRNCWELLSAIAKKGEPEQVKHMFHLLVTLGYCIVSNSLLGPLLRVHFLRGDTAGAVSEYMRCGKEYNMTPLQLELMEHLVSKISLGDSDATQQLEDVLASSTKVHGEKSTYATLAVALAKAGKRKELLNLIRKSGGKMNYSVLLIQCNRFAHQDDLDSLSIMTEALHNLPDFNISLLYSLMLSVCDKNGDFDAALKLWTEMQERNIVPPQTFLMSLQSLLKRHNKTVPFTLPEAST